MAQDRLDNVVLLGAGVLGGQIAWQSAFKGKSVVVYDLREEGLEQCRADQQRYADIITSYWGNQNNDEQMLRNARYIKEHFLDQGKLGLQTGEGFYKYPNPSYAAADFLDVPDITKADELAKLALPKK
jgi:3-hydroxyacyl-CoA dehydrogenase